MIQSPTMIHTDRGRCQQFLYAGRKGGIARRVVFELIKFRREAAKVMNCLRVPCGSYEGARHIPMRRNGEDCLRFSDRLSNASPCPRIVVLLQCVKWITV